MGSSDGPFPQGRSPLPPPSLPPPGAPTPPTAPMTQYVPGKQYVPVTSPPSAPGRNRGLLIGLGVVGALAVGVGAFLVFGGDDSPSAAPTTTAAPGTTATVPVTEPLATLPVLTAPDETFATVPATGPWGDIPSVTVADETGFFSIVAPADWYSSTEQRTLFGVPAVGISSSTNLDAYRQGDDELGVTVAFVSAGDVGGAMGLAGSYRDAVECVAEEWQGGYSTVLGPAELLTFDGCGTGGMFAKVVLSIDVGDFTLMVAAQGPGPASGDLLVITQTFLETVNVL